MRRSFAVLMTVCLIALAPFGCRERRNERRSESRSRSEIQVVHEAPAEAPAARTEPAPATAAPFKRAAMDAKKNPTAESGRGEPSLDDKDRPAAWVYIDGKGGKFVEKNGQRLLQWTIESMVRAKPTFRVEAYEPLLGTPHDFKSVLKTVQSSDGSYVDYRIAAKEGSFIVGKDYSLLKPGDNFTIRNAATGDVVQEIGPLQPGTYAIATSLRNNQTGKEASAVSYFTVATAP